MDITKNNAKRYTNSVINGETVNYGICALISFFMLLAFKQILKLAFGINADTAAYISFAVAEVALFLLQKLFFIYNPWATHLSKFSVCVHKLSICAHRISICAYRLSICAHRLSAFAHRLYYHIL